MFVGVCCEICVLHGRMLKGKKMLPIKHILSERFLDAECRCGYEVSEKLKKIWAVELDLFQELNRVCTKHDIRFHVCFGTLLGAIRHKGFIPWDDDFDVWMTRDDIKKLMAVAGEFSHPYFLQTPLSDRRFFTPHYRLRNSMTTGAIAGMRSPDYNNGIYVDIYPLDGLSDSRIKLATQYLFKRILIQFILSYHNVRTGGVFLRMTSKIFGMMARRKSYEFWIAAYDRIMSMYTSSETKLTFLLNGDWKGKGWYVTKEELVETDSVPYENVSVPVPKAYHAILSRTYGEYMEYPAASERGKWHEGIIHFEPDVPYVEYLKNHSSCK